MRLARTMSGESPVAVCRNHRADKKAGIERGMNRTRQSCLRDGTLWDAVEQAWRSCKGETFGRARHRPSGRWPGPAPASQRCHWIFRGSQALQSSSGPIQEAGPWKGAGRGLGRPRCQATAIGQRQSVRRCCSLAAASKARLHL